MCNDQVTLRDATEEDLELMLAWRSNPTLYEGHYEQGYLGRGILVWSEHYKWWESLSAWKNWIIELNDSVTRKRAVGSIWFSHLDTDSPDLGLYIGEVGLWNRGIGREALKLALGWLKIQGYKKASARILKENRRSIGLFRSLSFKNIGDSREGEEQYELWL